MPENGTMFVLSIKPPSARDIAPRAPVRCCGVAHGVGGGGQIEVLAAGLERELRGSSRRSSCTPRAAMTDDPTAVVLQWSPASGPEYVLGSGGTVSLHRIALDGGAVCDAMVSSPRGHRPSRSAGPQNAGAASFLSSPEPRTVSARSAGVGRDAVDRRRCLVGPRTVPRRSSDGADTHVLLCRRTGAPVRRGCVASSGRARRRARTRLGAGRLDVFLWDCGALARRRAPAFAGALIERPPCPGTPIPRHSLSAPATCVASAL